MHICKFAKEVNIVIRRESITKTAANYLIENINRTNNIKVHTHTEVVSVDGDMVLKNITIKNANTGEEKTLPAKALFIYIGAKPGTSWLNNIILKDTKGFIITGSDLMKEKSFNKFWKLERKPLLPETSVPGIFASGDVRSTAITGISSAVGEGAMAVRFVRKYLEEM
jgi:thioredoxin reductase (NADPH)